ncbi:MAG: geranylgeranyl reductase family protein [Bacteroidetes bacterium]|nr:geranylgeranyl reductase family protein [Bacteroidota bacterium]
MSDHNADILIPGAGPAGCACALSLADTGLGIAVIDKVVFPRHKTCGDAISTDTLNQLHKLPGTVWSNFDAISEKLEIKGVRIVSPNEKTIDIRIESKKTSNPVGYIVRRTDFDYTLFSAMKSFPNIHVYENTAITDVTISNDRVTLLSEGQSFSGKIAAFADGAHSIGAKQLAGHSHDPSHTCIAVQAYYENVNGFHPDNYIELHFNRAILPGYFWIFPAAGNTANVGIGILESTILKKKINLRTALEEIIHNHPLVAHRFDKAVSISDLKGSVIPLGSRKRNISGNRFLLLGDAASLVYPLLGEGIGNAIRSGRFAAAQIRECIKNNNFSATFNNNYDKSIYNSMWSELHRYHSIQKLIRKPGAFNFVVKKMTGTNASRELHLVVDDIPSVRNKLLNPLFYLRMLFR